MKKLKLTFVFIFMMVLLSLSSFTFAKEETEQKGLTLPKNIISITKSNTFPNSFEETEEIEPSEFTKALIATTDIKVNNPIFIRLLNESFVRPSPIAFGYRAEIYLGRWPLHYESQDSSIIWDYQQINENELNNVSGDVVQELRYIQQEEREVKGALTNKIDHATMIKTMMLQSLEEKTNLPLAFTTKVGANTKLNNFYNVPAKKVGILKAFTPAMNEKGQVTFGEVYVKFSGKNVSLHVKNVTKQGIGAWIPIQDHVSLSFSLQ